MTINAMDSNSCQKKNADFKPPDLRFEEEGESRVKDSFRPASKKRVPKHSY
jgi:hypothetical protein